MLRGAVSRIHTRRPVFAAALIGGAACLVVVALAVRRDEDPTGASLGSKPVRADAVGEVGEHVITERMIGLRRRHIDMYYPGSSSRENALAQLLQGYLSAEVLRAHKIVLDRRTWVAESDRMQRNTRNRDLLDRVVSVYGGDEEAYLYAGVLPDFARSRLFRHFRGTAAFAEPAREKAAAFLDQVVDAPDGFSARAEAAGAPVNRVLADPEHGVRPLDEKDPDGKGGGLVDLSPKSDQELAVRERMAQEAEGHEQEAARRLIALLDGLAEGAVHPNTLEAPESFHAVRLLDRRDGNVLEVEMAVFPKPDFDGWFWNEARKIPVVIHDRKLQAALLEKVTWARELKLTPE